jgi:hypothetical protein
LVAASGSRRSGEDRLHQERDARPQARGVRREASLGVAIPGVGDRREEGQGPGRGCAWLENCLAGLALDRVGRQRTRRGHRRVPVGVARRRRLARDDVLRREEGDLLERRRLGRCCRPGRALRRGPRLWQRPLNLLLLLLLLRRVVGLLAGWPVRLLNALRVRVGHPCRRTRRAVRRLLVDWPGKLLLLLLLLRVASRRRRLLVVALRLGLTGGRPRMLLLLGRRVCSSTVGRRDEDASARVSGGGWRGQRLARGASPSRTALSLVRSSRSRHGCWVQSRSTRAGWLRIKGCR